MEYHICVECGCLMPTERCVKYHGETVCSGCRDGLKPPLRVLGFAILLIVASVVLHFLLPEILKDFQQHGRFRLSVLVQQGVIRFWQLLALAAPLLGFLILGSWIWDRIKWKINAKSHGCVCFQHQARQDRLSQMELLSDAVKMFHSDYGHYPTRSQQVTLKSHFLNDYELSGGIGGVLAFSRFMFPAVRAGEVWKKDGTLAEADLPKSRLVFFQDFQVKILAEDDFQKLPWKGASMPASSQ